jgi:hypothetical protein
MRFQNGPLVLFLGPQSNGLLTASLQILGAVFAGSKLISSDSERWPDVDRTQEVTGAISYRMEGC